MEQVIVIYSSKYGRTKKYADWIGEKLDCRKASLEEIQLNQLKGYKVVIYGGGLYNGSVNGLEWLSKSYDAISDKKIIVFSCGVTDVENEENVNAIKQTIKKELHPKFKDDVDIFNFRSGIDYTRMSRMDKTKISIAKTMLSLKDYSKLSSEQKNFAYEYNDNMEFTNVKYIDPLVEFINGMEDLN